MATITTSQAYVEANDGVAEPFQPNWTCEHWTPQEHWRNRGGTVIRSGLYLNDRKSFASNILDMQTEINTLKAEVEALKNANVGTKP